MNRINGKIKNVRNFAKKNTVREVSMEMEKCVYICDEKEKRKDRRKGREESEKLKEGRSHTRIKNQNGIGFLSSKLKANR